MRAMVLWFVLALVVAGLAFSRVAPPHVARSHVPAQASS